MDLSSVILQISFLIIFGKMLAFGFMAAQDDRKCKFLKVDRMLKIRCYDMNLKEVPSNLKSSVEVLDLSYNRIKRLKRSSFEPYKSLQFLMLYENMIRSIEPGTFQHLKSLQEIDLSNNALLTIPLELFNLPSLRNLYVDSNELINLEQDLQHLEKPIRAPLEYLNVADCQLQNVPNLGPTPKLWHINASSNPLTELTIQRFANMCHLTSIDLTKTSLDDCTCQQINSHLRYIGAKTNYVPICHNALDETQCPKPYNFTVNSPEYHVCLNTRIPKAASFYWLLGSCTGGVVLLLLIIYCCLRQRKRRKAKDLRLAQSRKSAVVAPKNGIVQADRKDLDLHTNLDQHIHYKANSHFEPDIHIFNNHHEHKNAVPEDNELLRCDTA